MTQEEVQDYLENEDWTEEEAEDFADFLRHAAALEGDPDELTKDELESHFISYWETFHAALHPLVHDAYSHLVANFS